MTTHPMYWPPGAVAPEITAAVGMVVPGTMAGAGAGAAMVVAGLAAPAQVVPVRAALAPVAQGTTTNLPLGIQPVAENLQALHAPGERPRSAPWGTGRSLPWIGPAGLSRRQAIALPI